MRLTNGGMADEAREMAGKLVPPAPRKRVTMRSRTAHHEAGHAVLASAIGDRPHLVSIRAEGARLGVTRYRAPRGPLSSAVQIHLAGYAAEEILTGRRPRQLHQDVAFAVCFRGGRNVPTGFEGDQNRDGWLAVHDLLRAGYSGDDDGLKAQVFDLYGVALESLVAVWPTVGDLARALLRHGELDREGVGAAFGSDDIYTPVFDVQEAHGLGLAARDATGRT
jgi:hypothetical protein